MTARVVMRIHTAKHSLLWLTLISLFAIPFAYLFSRTCAFARL